jgi:hypothetical protein
MVVPPVHHHPGFREGYYFLVLTAFTYSDIPEKAVVYYGKS